MKHLNIIVEDEMALAVLCEQIECIVVGKVLKLDQDFLAVVLLDVVP